MMFGTVGRFYISFWPRGIELKDLVPKFNYNWDESTHFVHDDNPLWPDGTPLNREWSVNIFWLWFHVDISWTIDHPACIERRNARNNKEVSE